MGRRDWSKKKLLGKIRNFTRNKKENEKRIIGDNIGGKGD